MYTKAEIGALVRRLRKENLLSTEDLAKLTRLIKGTISGIELGINYPRNSTVKTLAAAFNVSPQYLIGVTDDPTPFQYPRIFGDEGAKKTAA